MRVVIQLVFYDKGVRGSRPVADLAFLTTFAYLSGLFAVAALGLCR